jgi:uncharacterized protein
MNSLETAAACAALLVPAAFGIDTSKLKPAGYVNDFAQVLDAAGEQRLQAYCGNLERVTGAQMAIVTIRSLEDDPIEDVANRLYREWGVGKRGKDEGILVLLAIREHRQRAEVGYGLEPIVPDGFAGGVLRGIRPILRQGNYGGALLVAAEQIGARIADAKGVALGEPALVQVRRPVSGSSPIPWPLVLSGLLALLWLFSRIGGGMSGGGTGFLTGMILGNLMGRGGWGGGGFGGYSDRGGGGGGFGGFGGGDSGGGGASSDW